jgi:hypothetical protein
MTNRDHVLRRPGRQVDTIPRDLLDRLKLLFCDELI